MCNLVKSKDRGLKIRLLMSDDYAGQVIFVILFFSFDS